MNDDVNYTKVVEELIENDKSEFLTKIEIQTEKILNDIENISSGDNGNGTAYVSSNQNGMGNILSPQP